MLIVPPKKPKKSKSEEATNGSDEEGKNASGDSDEKGKVNLISLSGKFNLRLDEEGPAALVMRAWLESVEGKVDRFFRLRSPNQRMANSRVDTTSTSSMGRAARSAAPASSIASARKPIERSRCLN